MTSPPMATMGGEIVSTALPASLEALCGESGIRLNHYNGLHCFNARK
jgi:hypothetical protein